MTTSLELTRQVEQRLLARNQVFESFFAIEARKLAEACREMSERFLRGGRLLAFGRGPYATDAQHVSVEFVHPVIVGKRALPALDLSLILQHRKIRVKRELPERHHHSHSGQQLQLPLKIRPAISKLFERGLVVRRGASRRSRDVNVL